jgi:Holliday junction resolvase RusA-like endonuclease
MTGLSFTIPGAPRTSKNHTWRTKAGHQMPSMAYMEWNRQAVVHCLLVRACGRSNLPVRTEVNCCALFYREALTGDAVGYYQALADTLEKAGIVENDRLIVSWDGSRMLKDAKNPRVEVTLESV